MKFFEKIKKENRFRVKCAECNQIIFPDQFIPKNSNGELIHHKCYEDLKGIKESDFIELKKYQILFFIQKYYLLSFGFLLILTLPFSSQNYVNYLFIISIFFGVLAKS